MSTQDELKSLLTTRSFSETRGDETVELISLDDVISLLSERYFLVNKNGGLEYAYAKSEKLNGAMTIIGDRAAFDAYVLEIAELDTVPIRRYFTRPRDARSWSEIKGPDSNFLNWD